MEIKILGTGCASCKTLENAVRKAVEEMHLNATILREENIMKILEYGVMRTPGLVINEKVIFSGRVPTMSSLKEILKSHA